MIEKTINTSKTSDSRTLDMLNNMYNIRFFNTVYANHALIKRNINKIKSSEIATIATMFSFSGFPRESIEFYDHALTAAHQEKVPTINMRRDKAQTLLLPGNTQDIAAARRIYVEILSELKSDKSGAGRRSSAIFLSELAIAEAASGDWKCSVDLRQQGGNLLQLVRFHDDSVAIYLDMFDQYFRRAAKRTDQAEEGCAYVIEG